MTMQKDRIPADDLDLETLEIEEWVHFVREWREAVAGAQETAEGQQ
jgi:hypothetical protein